MPAVRGLEDYLRTLEIVEARPLHELDSTTIGVDVFQWLRSNNFICKESLHSALGGLPITLEQQIHSQLLEFHKWKIHPLFVFNGLKYSQNARAPFSSSRSRKYAAKRKQAWKAMENDNISKAIDLFSQISGYVSISAQDDLIRIFCRWNAMIPSRNKSLNAQYEERLRLKAQCTEPNLFKSISWIRAPYYAASQMAYLESSEEMLHAVCGGCDLLMFGGEKVILNIDFKMGIYEVTDLDHVLYALGVNHDPYSFIDSCLLSGFDASRTFAPLTLNKDNKRSNSRRNFSYKFALDRVLKKGNGIDVINDYLNTLDGEDEGSVMSYDSAQTSMTMHSTKSVGVKSTFSMKSVHSAVNTANINSLRSPSGNIDKILQKMLKNDENKQDSALNPKYSEYKALYLLVSNRVKRAKVLSFNGETVIYKPFKWMTSDGSEHKDDEYSDIPLNVYRLLSVGILSTFLCSAILGGHLIDTTPLIDSQELENAMNNCLPLRQRILHIFQNAFNTCSTISLQRWFQPNRDIHLKYDSCFASKWVSEYKFALNVLFNNDNKLDNVSLITPLKVICFMRSNGSFNTLFIDGTTSFKRKTDNEWIVPQITNISQLLIAAYCGTLITLNYLNSECKLSAVAIALSKINKFEFETVLALEMLQNEDLTEKTFTLIDENGKVFQIDSKIKKTLRLLSRVCSLLPIRPFIDGKTSWNSKLSHCLAAANHITTAYHHGIKNCIESSITWLYCNICNKNNNNMISPSFLKELALTLKQLPPEPCTGIGVLIREFVKNFAFLNWNDISIKTDDENKSQILNEELKSLQKQFPVFTRIHYAIQCCFQFFYQICTLVKELCDENILKQSIVNQFEDCYEYLRELGIWDAIYFMEITHKKSKKIKQKK